MQKGISSNLCEKTQRRNLNPQSHHREAEQPGKDCCNMDNTEQKDQTELRSKEQPKSTEQADTQCAPAEETENLSVVSIDTYGDQQCAQISEGPCSSLLNQVSVHLPLETVSNLRDLAGMETEDGRFIAPGLLFRSGRLSKASKEDLLTLKNMGIKDVIDFRSELERSVEPDRKIPGAVLLEDPIFKEADLKKMTGGNFKLLKMAAKSSRDLMNDAYASLITSPDAQTGCRKFFDVLLQAEGGVLWHCTQGKDRTGAAAAMIEHALGVKEDQILADYLQTNLYMTREARQDRDTASALFDKDLPVAEEDIASYLFAHRSYYDAMNHAVQTAYGSWDQFLEEAMELTPEKREILKKKYLVSPQSTQ